MIRTASSAIALASMGTVTREQWVHLMPAGIFTARDGRGPWAVDDAKGVIAASVEHASGRPIAVDYDHQIDNAAKNGQPAPAAGWINRMEARADGIWGLIEWTAAAAEHLSRREYRFISPVFTFTPDNKVQSIIRAGLTNAPALTLTALATESTNMDPTAELLSQIRKLLGLAESATAAEITAAIGDLLSARTSAVPPIDQFVPIATLRAVTAELQKFRHGVSVEHASTVVNAAVTSGRLPPALKAWGIELCQVNKPAFDNFVGATGAGFSQLCSTISPAGSPASDAHGSDIEAAIAAQLGHSPADMARTRKTAQ